jgi:hypothetical protein
MTKETSSYVRKQFENGNDISWREAVKGHTISQGLRFSLATGNWGLQGGLDIKPGVAQVRLSVACCISPCMHRAALAAGATAQAIDRCTGPHWRLFRAGTGNVLACMAQPRPWHLTGLARCTGPEPADLCVDAESLTTHQLPYGPRGQEPQAAAAAQLAVGRCLPGRDAGRPSGGPCEESGTDGNRDCWPPYRHD